MQGRTPVGVLGATGTVGDRLVRLLIDHPWLELAEVGASERSAGSTLASRLPPSEFGDLPEGVGNLPLKRLDEDWKSPLILSALPSGIAAEIEPALARKGHVVVSNASAFRMDPDVPLVIPEVNPDHLSLIERQSARWSGAIVTNPNCVVAGLALALAPLERAFGIERMLLTTFQAISGAGRPGPAAGVLNENVIPFIQGEEEKVGPECRTILGTVDEGGVVEAPIQVSATTTRVPVLDGHLASVSVTFRSSPSLDDVAEAFTGYEGDPAAKDLPFAPDRPIELLTGPDRPQPRFDRDRGNGMTVSVGRLRPCQVMDAKFMVLSHNLVRGAAGAALLNAELCTAQGRVP